MKTGPESGLPQSPPLGKAIRVALVGQSADSIRHVSAMLGSREDIVPVSWVASGSGHDEILSRLAAASPSAILLDAGLNQGRALELLRLLHKTRETASLPILLLTPKAIPEFRSAVLSLGAHEYLTYESAVTEVIARLRYHVKRGQELRDVRKNASGLAVPAQHAIKILMVDESKVACQIVARVFANHPDLQFTACTDPTRAIQIADELLPTVILQSLVVGDSDSFELVAAMRRNFSTRDVPIIVLSGVADPSQKARALTVGADDYVVKSKDMGELLSRVRFHSDGYFTLLKGRLASSADDGTAAEEARVLLIDDSKFFCAAIGQLISSEPHIRFLSCTDPTLALETACQFRPTVILQDLEMPHISGLELLQRFREDPRTRDIPIIVLSGISEAATKAKVFTEGANDYVEKQIDKVELVSRIRYHSRGYHNALRLGDSIQKLFEIQRRLESQSEFIRKTFGRYLSDDVVTSLLASPEGLKLGGEKRRITILMADLRGFTSLAERLLPEQVLAIINNYLRVMTVILMSYGATIDEFLGDAILAMFGAPKPQEDDAQRAVACAVEMQQAMQGVNAANRKEGYPEVQMGIGVHTGEVVVGNIGSEKRAKYGVVGKNVNLTSRIESYTLGGQILVSDATRQACGDILRIDSAMEVVPKGVLQPLPIFEVGGIGGTFQRFLPVKKLSVLRPLAAFLPVRFSVLEDKHGGATVHAARIVALAEDAAVIMAPEIELAKLANLKLSLLAEDGSEITTELYGKVTLKESQPGFFRVDFTSIPPEAAALFNLIRGAKSC